MGARPLRPAFRSLCLTSRVSGGSCASGQCRAQIPGPFLTMSVCPRPFLKDCPWLWQFSPNTPRVSSAAVRRTLKCHFSSEVPLRDQAAAPSAGLWLEAEPALGPCLAFLTAGRPWGHCFHNQHTMGVFTSGPSLGHCDRGHRSYVRRLSPDIPKYA